MEAHDMFWKLETVSDRQLIERVGVMLGSSRRVMAELIAHLGEVEERRLHLVAACSSMFAYCLELGMSEDEAYRRIEVARLARRYPAIFPLLAAGQLSISVVALLKHHLSEENHLELIATVTGKSVAQARELIAARFPRPEVASSVRKLPERRTEFQPSLALSTGAESRKDATEPCDAGTAAGGSARRTESRFTSNMTEPLAVGRAPSASAIESSSTSKVTEPCAGGRASRGTTSSASTMKSHTPVTESPHRQRGAPPPPASRIEPLSAQRYKVQLTASAELARKLELARDLMRHSVPGGELGPIIERALDLLIESLMKQRFGKKVGPKRAREPETSPATTQPPDTTSHGVTKRDTDATEPAIAEPAIAKPTTTTLDSARVQAAPQPDAGRASISAYIPRSTRRRVVERDGLGCSWVDEHGVRCGSRAWLEYDHRHPRAKGGGAQPDNVRLLCRQHNRFAAEREYGRRHVEHAIAERRRERAQHVAPVI